MNNKNMILTVVLTIITTALITIGAMNYWSKQTESNQAPAENVLQQDTDIKDTDLESIPMLSEDKEESSNTQSTANETQVVESTEQDNQDESSSISEELNLISYENKTLSISFHYPENWGEITQEEDGTDHIALSIFKKPIVLLAADNGGESIARGAYWGDMAESIVSQDYIDNLCNVKNEAESCQIKSNQYGIKYAKVVEEVIKFGEPTIETNYYIFNSKSEFRGLIISTERLVTVDIDNLEDKLQSLVDSFKFI